MPDGFEIPNYTQTPNVLFDTYMREMTEAELKVVLAVIRYSIGYHRTAFRISLRKMKELTGLSQNGVIAGAEAAEERGLIRRIVNGKRSTTWEAITTASFDEALGLEKTASVSEAKLPQSVRKSQKTV